MKKIINLKIKGSDWMLEFADKIDNQDDCNGLTSYNDKKNMYLKSRF